MALVERVEKHEQCGEVCQSMQMEVQSRTSKGSHGSDAGDRRYGLNWKGVYPCDELRANIDGEQYLAKKASVFNLKIAYHNRTRLSEAEEMAHNATYCSSLHELLSVSDIVSINCPLNAKTENLISEPEFAAMKDGAFFVNTARGAIVNEAALKQAIDSGKICRAGVDVLCNEPDVDPWFFEQDNVIVQPHLGGLTDVAFQKAERECFENVKAFFEKGKANSPVNTTK